MGRRRSATEVAAVRARLRVEFVSNLSSPGTPLEAMPLSSTDWCQWRCTAEECGHQWPARLQFRTRTVKPSGCPECWKRRNRAPGPGESLAEVDPALARQFRRNLSRPDRGPDTLRPQSHDLCEWECAQGHFWPATLANRTNGRGCRDCTGHGRSPFECNVAMLVEAASGLSVAPGAPSGSRQSHCNPLSRSAPHGQATTATLRVGSTAPRSTGVLRRPFGRASPGAVPARTLSVRRQGELGA
ncbi:zinc-ribbon domain-containing protein [Streptomyces umbrinus]|uniref:zinc-ribbon domain-containing protein n=1 Tax=Streptomyces umbrinus TaxID=67370 RepID=UPI003C2E7E11